LSRHDAPVLAIAQPACKLRQLAEEQVGREDGRPVWALAETYVTPPIYGDAPYRVRALSGCCFAGFASGYFPTGRSNSSPDLSVWRNRDGRERDRSHVA
jgi:hypothetical protein